MRQLTNYLRRGRAAIAFAAIGWSPLVAHADEPLLILYLERPPYYYTDNGTAKGFLLTLTQRALARAGIVARYESRSPKRVLQEIEDDRAAVCSIGWFRNPERERFALFSKEIFRNKPWSVLTHRDTEKAVRGHGSLRELTRDHGLRFGVVAGFSYGPAIDEWIAAMGENVDRTATTTAINVKKVELGRVHYTLIDDVEREQLIQEAGAIAGNLVSASFPDIPPGNSRHLMCSRKVGAATMARIDQAIGSVLAGGER